MYFKIKKDIVMYYARYLYNISVNISLYNICICIYIYI